MKRILILLNFLFLLNLIVLAQSGWIPQESETTYSIDAVFFIGDTGYGIYGNGQTNGNFVLKTINGGATWQICHRMDNQFYSIYFTDTNTGYAVDYYGIQQTKDGGASWDRVYDNHSLSKYSFLHSIFFANSLTGYCVGGFDQFSPILKTSDGGKTWTDKSSQFGKALNSLYFVNADTGYVVGNAGTILRTNDGGNTWTKQISGTDAYLCSVDFLNANIGYVVGSGGTILKTTNGGVNWVPQSSGTTNELKSVCFIDANSGYAVGGLVTEYDCYPTRFEGIILKTTDGGMNWTAQAGAETNYLYSVFFTDNHTGYIIGSNGLILKTTTGETHSTLNLTADNNFKIYPNPNHGVFTIEYPNANERFVKIEIRDLTGNKILETSCSQNFLRVDKKELHKGLYVVSVIIDDQCLNQKFVVK